MGRLARQFPEMASENHLGWAFPIGTTKHDYWLTPMADDGTGSGGIIAFGPFRVDRPGRLIERDGQVVQLGSRAFDILVCLLERSGQIVGKAELLRRVWPNNIVEEGSLRFHIHALRKALGEGRYIANITGQGYSFVALVSRLPDEQPADMKSTSARKSPN